MVFSPVTPLASSSVQRERPRAAAFRADDDAPALQCRAAGPRFARPGRTPTSARDRCGRATRGRDFRRPSSCRPAAAPHRCRMRIEQALDVLGRSGRRLHVERDAGLLQDRGVFLAGREIAAGLACRRNRDPLGRRRLDEPVGEQEAPATSSSTGPMISISSRNCCAEISRRRDPSISFNCACFALSAMRLAPHRCPLAARPTRLVRGSWHPRRWHRTRDRLLGSSDGRTIPQGQAIVGD